MLTQKPSFQQTDLPTSDRLLFTSLRVNGVGYFHLVDSINETNNMYSSQGCLDYNLWLKPAYNSGILTTVGTALLDVPILVYLHR